MNDPSWVTDGGVVGIGQKALGTVVVRGSSLVGRSPPTQARSASEPLDRCAKSPGNANAAAVLGETRNAAGDPRFATISAQEYRSKYYPSGTLINRVTARVATWRG
jgi:hypothetical protein